MKREDLLSILKRNWGYDRFRSNQENIINSVLEGRDTLALLPTGGGKSLCFQVPAMAMNGMCIVVSPLIALMKDQVENLLKRGIPAACLYSGMTQSEMALTMDKAVDDELKFLYVSPERLESKAFRINVPQFNINLLAIDEAHCISQFGYDFRPPYLNIAEFRQLIPNITCVALTATATPEVAIDIQEKLNFNKRNVFQSSFARENLTYFVFKEENKYGRMLNIIKKMKGSGIVYVRNRRKTKEIAEFLNKQGISAAYYNAGLDNRSRNDVQQSWINNETQVIVATNAFGMGIDKPDCRFVIHIDLPDSLEAYFQEAGRGGRDGNEAVAVILFDEKDKTELKTNFEKSYPELKYIRNVYEAVCNYFKIPVGAGEEAVFDFDLNKFCDSYQLNPVLAYNSLKFIERQGLISLSDNFNDTSKVLIKADKDEIYNIQVKNPVFTMFLETLMRNYSGLFSDFVKISEHNLAKKMHTETSEITMMLNKLSKIDALEYIPATNKPKIIFTSERRNSFYIDDEYYKDRKQASQRMIDAMLHYVDSNNCCRSVLLLNYFGEKDSKTCGECDYCLADKTNSSKTETLLKEDILKILQTNDKISVEDLLLEIKNFDKKVILAEIRQLVDEDKLFFNDFGQIERTKK